MAHTDLNGHRLDSRRRAHPKGALVFQHACKLSAEGIVSKRLGSRYRSGRTPDWLKFKNPEAPAALLEAEEDWGRRGDDGNLFSMEEYLARYEGKVEHAIHGHYADAGEDQIYAESPGGPFAPVIVHDTPLFPALIFEGIAAVYGPRTNFAAVWRGCHI